MKTIARFLGAATLAVMAAGPAFAVQQQVPEIDASQGLAAIAVLLCVGMILREKFLREHNAKA